MTGRLPPETIRSIERFFVTRAARDSECHYGREQRRSASATTMATDGARRYRSQMAHVDQQEGGEDAQAHCELEAEVGGAGEAVVRATEPRWPTLGKKWVTWEWPLSSDLVHEVDEAVFAVLRDKATRRGKAGGHANHGGAATVAAIWRGRGEQAREVGSGGEGARSGQGVDGHM